MIKAFYFFILLISFVSKAQTTGKPKLVVGIVIDQMRWDYLYRFKSRYIAEGGFNRLLQKGYVCENTFIPYAPSLTGCGHASIYTGSVPAVNGITGNAWIDRLTGKYVYCSEDLTVKTVGSTTDAGLMSPKNLLTTTICDELRLATNNKSK
ncbi:MAG TPA: alkaline phosphatase family protein, partial [Chitinophagaceae bacterium]|nr:alkaline phosphatase family protein [Chitinophagaceae bacterium]